MFGAICGHRASTCGSNGIGIHLSFGVTVFVYTVTCRLKMNLHRRLVAQ